MELTYKVFNKIDDLEEIWRSLCENQQDLSPFQEFELAKMACDHYWPYWFVKRTVCKFYVFYDLQRPVLILPIEKHFFSNKCWLFAVVHGFNYRDLICREQKYISPCIALFNKEVAPLIVVGLPKDSPTYKAIEQTYEFQNAIKFENCFKINFIDIIKANLTIQNEVEEDRFELAYKTYFQSLSKSVKQNLRTSYNRLEKQEYNVKFLAYYGGGTLVVKNGNSLETKQIDSTEIRNLFDRIKTLYRERHVTRYGRSLLKERLLEKSFAVYSYENYPKALTLMITYNGELAGFMSGYVSRNGVYTVPRLAIDDKFGFFSPGMMLINESIKYFIEHTEIKTMDLSKGNEAYKAKMGGSLFQIADFIADFNKK